jgi:transposase InsO family protein
MPRTRRQHDARCRFKVALETARELRTINEIASENNLHDYFQLYNYERPHKSLGYRAPADVYFAVKEALLLSV